MFSDFLGYQNHLVTTGTADNPMITEVEKKIVDQNSDQNDSRSIIFVRTRYEATILNEILNKNERLRNLGINSEWISGINIYFYHISPSLSLL